MSKSVVITGLTGQDASILAEQLLETGEYQVFGLVRRNSQHSLGCATGLPERFKQLEVVEGDLLDLPSLTNLVKKARPDYFYNAASQSHVGSSFEQPIYTAQATGLGVLNCLEAIRLSGIHSRFLQFSTSEMFGGISSEPCNEQTSFHPRSPYGVAKLYGYWITVNYRQAYKMFASNVIMFNHEGPGKRGPNFVTRKITLAIAAIKAGKQDKLYLGNLKAKRDWGYAPDFTEGCRLVLESAAPDDFVLATGETHTVEEFCSIAFEHAGLGDYRQYTEIDPQFYRPAEVDVLLGDYSKINRELGWAPKTTFRELVCKMVDADLNATPKKVL